MKVVNEIVDPWTELAFQDLLLDVAAVVAATKPGRSRNANDPEWTEGGVSRKSPLAGQAWSRARII